MCKISVVDRYVMINLPVIITPLRTYLYGQTSFWMEVNYLQHFLIEYLEKYSFLNIANANFILANMKLIIQLCVSIFLPTWKHLNDWKSPPKLTKTESSLNILTTEMNHNFQAKILTLPKVPSWRNKYLLFPKDR